MSKNGGWEEIREAVRHRVGASAYEAWFRGLEGRLEGHSLVIRCPDRFSRDWIKGRYGRLIREAAPGVRDLTYEISSLGDSPTPVEPSRRPAAPVAPVVRPIRRSESGFESFVSGPSNVLALEAARAVAQGRAGHCSPLVLAGGSGVGKTHLCRSIRGELGEGVVYRSSEEFTTEVTRAMRAGKMEPLRQRYRRSLNVLILEDIQFFVGKRATQVELFHTLDHLISRGKPVVLSAACPPQEISGLDTQLTSRMSSGLVACISPPGLETRRTILREKAAGGGVRIPEACLEILACRSVRSVRDLLAGLNQVVARASLLRRAVTPDLVAEALAAVDVPGRPRSVAEILELVGRAYGLNLEELSGPSRRRRVVRPRQLAMYLCRLYTEASLKEIGRAFRRDHTSVIYAVEVTEKRIAERPQLRYELETLARRISPSPGSDSGAGSTPGTHRT